MKFPVIFKKYCFKKDYIPSHYIHEWPFIYNLGLKCLLVNFKFINKLNSLCHRKYGLQVALAGICTSFTKLFMQLGGFHVVYIPVCVFFMQKILINIHKRFFCDDQLKGFILCFSLITIMMLTNITKDITCSSAILRDTGSYKYYFHL